MAKTDTCKACKVEVDGKAKVCPSCGAKMKMGLGKKLLIGFAVLFVLGWMMPKEDSTPTASTAPVVAAVEKASPITASDKELLKQSYANLDSTQRGQFSDLAAKYVKLSDTEKADIKTDFERLKSEQDVAVAKALKEATEKAKAEEAARAAAKLASLKSDAQVIPYKELARNPDAYKGKTVKYTGKVIQVQEDGNNVGLRVNVTKNTYGYENTMFITYDKGIISGRVLEDDIISFWGTSAGLLTYKTVMGSEMSIPQVLVQIVEVN